MGLSIKRMLVKIAIKWVVPMIADIIAKNLSKEKVIAFKNKIVDAIKGFFVKSTFEVAGIKDEDFMAPLLAKLDELNLEETEYVKAMDAIFDVLENAVIDSDLKINGITDNEMVLPLIRRLRERLDVLDDDNIG